MTAPRDDNESDPLRVRVRSPRGRQVDVVAVRRGIPLRTMADGSGQLAGLLMEIVLNIGAWLVSRARRGWTVGVVSVDVEPWAGQRVLHKEAYDGSDPKLRVDQLAADVESGTLPIPQPRDWRFKRKP